MTGKAGGDGRGHGTGPHADTGRAGCVPAVVCPHAGGAVAGQGRGLLPSRAEENRRWGGRASPARAGAARRR